MRAVPAPVGVTLGPDGFLWRERAGGNRIPAPMALAISMLAIGDVWHASLHARLGGRAGRPSAGVFSDSRAEIGCSRIAGPLGAPRRDDGMTQPPAKG